MIKNKEVYKNIYFVFNPEKLSEKGFNALLMCGSKNWNHYFYNLDKKSKKHLNFEEIKNVELIEFEEEKEMIKFWKTLEDEKKIDYSVEHNFPCVLKYV